MDANSSNSDINICKKCNKIVKCDNCNGLYQVTCAKLSNIVKLVSDSAISFSENLYQPDKDDSADSSALEDYANQDRKVVLCLL